jgi:ABC-type glycerol-3-phosphate transport system substrate-binding protein
MLPVTYDGGKEVVMKKARRTTRLLAAAGLVLVVLAAASAAGAARLGGGAPASSARSQDTKLEIWCWSGAIDALKAVDAPFSRAHPDIDIKYVQLSPGDLYQKLQLAVAAGSGFPDISCIEDSHLYQIVKLGPLADITNRVKPYLGKIAAPSKWDAARRNGRYYAMPWDAGPLVLFYRRSVFRQAGVKASSILTWNDYYRAARTIKRKTGVPMWQNSKAHNDARLFESLLWQQGLGYVDANGRVVLDKNPSILRTLEYMGKFWKAGLATEPAPWTNPWYDEISGAKVATLPMAQWMSIFLKSWLAPKTSGDWGVTLLPAWKKGGARSANDGGSALSIFKSSDNKDAAWTYIQYHLGRADSQAEIYKKTDYFPSLKAAFSTPYVRQPDPYYAGQKVHLLFKKALGLIPKAHVYSTDYQQMNTLMSTEIQNYALGKKSARKALADAAKAIRARTGRH